MLTKIIVIFFGCYLLYAVSDQFNPSHEDIKNINTTNEYILVHEYQTKFDALVKSIDDYIQQNSNGSKLEAATIIQYCMEERFDVSLLLAQGQLESNFGTCGQARRTNSPWNIVGPTYQNPNHAILPFIRLVNTTYLRGRNVSALFNSYTNKNGARYAEDKTYEVKLKALYWKIRSHGFNDRILELIESDAKIKNQRHSPDTINSTLESTYAYITVHGHSLRD